MKKIYLILFSAIVISSCSDTDALSPVNQTRISEANAFETPERVQQTVLGLYAGVKDGQFYGGRYFNYQDVRGEEFNNDRSNGVTNLLTWNFGIASSTSEVNNLWNAGYLAINRCNVVIKGLETSPISTALKTQYTAEAAFLRALSYYSLVTLYARPYWDSNGATPGLPLRLNAETSSGNSDLVRSSVAEIYDQIIIDLDFAENNLLTANLADGVNSSAYNNTTRAHRNTAIALKTRVYLSMRKYDKVILEANKIVSNTAPFSATSGVPNRLAPAIASVFATPALTSENIFSFAFSPTDIPGTQNSLVSYYSNTAGTGEYSLISTGIISNLGWKTTDARRALNIVNGGKTYLNKWTKSTGDPDYVAVIRYSEILLNLAEAIVRDNNSIDARAVALLNAVRQRSDATTVFTVASFTNAQALLDQLAIERRIELLGEGFRSLDVMRLGQDFAAKGTASAVTSTDNQYIWPIPLSELLYNKLCVQNGTY
ncbi:RagB/SusD family nutrient uptake outer membrane protein [Flavobacterium sp. ZE23DGlu08]|uniref:RagB/SusD family nutrient uptake outer membrane protein n=1 Tax=Flavobacterium sp. ZE23DGlu08 TaxID=3059026 RepID=UPI00265FAF2F|nr:RagB/SusD family nutrient uptake outer membrane protein [Flavobacterium sp. ZE23DGlu08]WKL43065.1 RagB/SusD family nutrient uptake outer membrane protein [Flavobacterium sp. ZE23DGlu08]